MTENGNKSYPVRTLTVENFSVIKHAKLEFGKITVLIGPQASGKSLLCKLAYFLGKHLVELAVQSVVNDNSWDEYLRDAAKAFWERFSSGDGLVFPGTSLTFKTHRYEVSMGWGANPNLPTFRFGRDFRDEYESLRSKPSGAVPPASGALIPPGANPGERLVDIWLKLNDLLSVPPLVVPLYIPAGRAFFTTTSKGFAVLQNVGLDSITREFSSLIQWDGRWKVGMLTLGRPVNEEISREMTEISRGFVMMDSGVPRFITHEGWKLPLEVLSTGIQEMLPLFNVLEQLIYLREDAIARELADYDPARAQKPVSRRSLLYLEEPEANVFPKTQYDLVKLFARLAGDPFLNFDWVITTHSPYILSSFNNLIEAGQAARNKPELHDEVAKIVPEQYWVKEGDFKAYAIEDGELRSILNESGFVEGNYLDQVSETINDEFDRLIKLEYDHAKAS